jgi:iron complex transport system substrate-binding protein
MRRSSLVLVLVVLLGAGCGERAEPVGELAQPYPVRVRGAGDRATVLRDPPQRIVAVAQGPAEIVAALGAADLLVGAPASTDVGAASPPAVVVRRTGQVDIAAVVALEPDLILATAGTDPLELARAEREAAAVAYVQPSSSVAGVQRGIIELGFLLDRAPAARELVGGIRREIAAVRERLAGNERVSVFVDSGFRVTVPSRSLLGDLIRLAEGESIAGVAPGPDPFPARELRQADPDVYVALSGSRVTLASLRSDPATTRLRAVRERRFAVLSEELVTRPGPDLAAALEAVARALHPDAFG